MFKYYNDFIKLIGKNIKYCIYWVVFLVVYGRKKKDIVFILEFKISYFFVLIICLFFFELYLKFIYFKIYILLRENIFKLDK